MCRCFEQESWLWHSANLTGPSRGELTGMVREQFQ